MSIFTPINQVKLTNVSIVRMKKGGKRYELACYKNKVLEWRNGVETDIDNVLQTHQVFLNVSKGQVAREDEVLKMFKQDSIGDCVLEILKRGELQVGEKERQSQLSTTYTEIATLVSSKCVNPTSNRPYPVTMIEKAMQESLHYSVNLNKNAKQQALEVIRLLQESGIMPIAPAQMRIRLIMPAKDGKRLKDKLLPMLASVEEEDWNEEYELIALIEPGKFRDINTIIQDDTKGKGQLEVLSVSETNQTEEEL